MPQTPSDENNRNSQSGADSQILESGAVPRDGMSLDLSVGSDARFSASWGAPMLEIVVLHRLCRLVGRLSRTKGLPALWFQTLLVGAFLGGEVYGGVAAAVMSAIAAPPGQHEAPLGLMYAAAVFCAGLGTLGVFALAWVWPTRQSRIATEFCAACGEGHAQAADNRCPMCGHAEFLPSLVKHAA